MHLQALPDISAGPLSRTNAAGGTVGFSVTATGVGPLRYAWRFNGTNLPPAIITVAGNGAGQINSGTYSGDGGFSTNAGLYDPRGVGVDSLGNLYIADTYNHRVRKVDTNGIITTVAGNGTGTYAGDGGLATNASLGVAADVVADNAGNFYFSDDALHCVRKVDAAGIITTVAGKPGSLAGYGGDGDWATNAFLNQPTGLALDSTGNLYIADTYNHRIRRVGLDGKIETVAGNGGYGYCGDDDYATNACLWVPMDVAVNSSGSLFIVDAANRRVRKVNAEGIISTVAGFGYSREDGPATNAFLENANAVIASDDGVFYLTESLNNRISRIGLDGMLTRIAGNGSSFTGFSGDGGAATNASLNWPHGLAMDSLGNLYFADQGNERIRKIAMSGLPAYRLEQVQPSQAGDYTVVITDAEGSITSAVATLTVPVPPSVLTHPASQTVLPGVAVTFGVTVNGTPPLDIHWYHDSVLVQEGSALSYALPVVAAGDAGSYWVVVTNEWGSATSRVASLNLAVPLSITSEPASVTAVPASSTVLSVGAVGTGPLTYQWQLNGTNIPNDIISLLAGNGSTAFCGDGGAARSACLNRPAAVAGDKFGNVYLIDSYNQRIRRINPNGVISTIAGTGYAGFSGDGGLAVNAALSDPGGLSTDSRGNLYIADTGNNRIRKIATNGIITTIAGLYQGFAGDGLQATNAYLTQPLYAVVDAAGFLYIADTGNSRIRKVTPEGIITTIVGGGIGADGGPALGAYMYHPTSVALDRDGNLFIAEAGNNQIRKVNTSGIITTVAGYYSGFYGDGGPAVGALLRNPVSLAFDWVGNLFIADQNNLRIRRIDTAGIITTIAGTGTQGYSGENGPATNANLCQPAGLSFDSAGNLVFADTCNSRLRKIGLAGSPTLALSNITSNRNVGDYRVVITSPYGCVTSSVAHVAVFPSVPWIVRWSEGSDGSLSLSCASATNSSSRVWRTTALGSGTWEPISTNLSGTNGLWQFTDTNAAPKGFYRISTP